MKKIMLSIVLVNLLAACATQKTMEKAMSQLPLLLPQPKLLPPQPELLNPRKPLLHPLLLKGCRRSTGSCCSKRRSRHAGKP